MCIRDRWQAKLADGYTTDSYRYVTYEDSGEAYRGRGFVYLSLIHIYRGTARNLPDEGHIPQPMGAAISMDGVRVDRTH